MTGRGGSGGSTSSGGNAGSMLDAGTDAAEECVENEPCAAEGVNGTCRNGQCCTGCWDGDACQTGDASAACGAGGGNCAVCSGGQCSGSAPCSSSMQFAPVICAGGGCVQSNTPYCCEFNACDSANGCLQ
jgi:hypothetical protein